MFVLKKLIRRVAALFESSVAWADRMVSLDEREAEKRDVA